LDEQKKGNDSTNIKKDVLKSVFKFMLLFGLVFVFMIGVPDKTLRNIQNATQELVSVGGGGVSADTIIIGNMSTQNSSWLFVQSDNLTVDWNESRGNSTYLNVNNQKFNETGYINILIQSLNSLSNFSNNMGFPNSTRQLSFITTANASWVNSIETDSAHDSCSEISGCVVGAITSGNTGWTNIYDLITMAQALAGLGNWSSDKPSYATNAKVDDANSTLIAMGATKLNISDPRWNNSIVTTNMNNTINALLTSNTTTNNNLGTLNASQRADNTTLYNQIVSKFNNTGGTLSGNLTITQNLNVTTNSYLNYTYYDKALTTYRYSNGTCIFDVTPTMNVSIGC
jgi:hypothetical protein